MAEKIDISVIVPIYNCEKYIRKGINSVLGQTFKNYEVILINDGSKDNSLSICLEYKQKDNRITIIDKKNTGVSDTRNLRY